MLAASTLEVLKKTLLSILLFFEYHKEKYSSSSRTPGNDQQTNKLQRTRRNKDVRTPKHVILLPPDGTSPGL
jgi:hypothetical protein